MSAFSSIGGKGFFSRGKWAASLICIVLACATMLTGCYGSFPLTRAVYGFNGDITQYDLVHTVVFWVFVIVPVYEVAMIVDAIIPNLIEFWTGKDFNASVRTEKGDAVVTMEPTDNPNEMLVRFDFQEAPDITLLFARRSDERIDVFEQHGLKIGEVVRDVNGDISLCDGAGGVIGIIEGDYLLAMDVR